MTFNRKESKTYTLDGGIKKDTIFFQFHNPTLKMTGREYKEKLHLSLNNEDLEEKILDVIKILSQAGSDLGDLIPHFKHIHIKENTHHLNELKLVLEDLNYAMDSLSDQKQLLQVMDTLKNRAYSDTHKKQIQGLCEWVLSVHNMAKELKETREKLVQIKSFLSKNIFSSHELKKLKNELLKESKNQTINQLFKSMLGVVEYLLTNPLSKEKDAAKLRDKFIDLEKQINQLESLSQSIIDSPGKYLAKRKDIQIDKKNDINSMVKSINFILKDPKNIKPNITTTLERIKNDASQSELKHILMYLKVSPTQEKTLKYLLPLKEQLEEALEPIKESELLPPFPNTVKTPNKLKEEIANGIRGAERFLTGVQFTIYLKPNFDAKEVAQFITTTTNSLKEAGIRSTILDGGQLDDHPLLKTEAPLNHYFSMRDDGASKSGYVAALSHEAIARKEALMQSKGYQDLILALNRALLLQKPEKKIEEGKNISNESKVLNNLYCAIINLETSKLLAYSAKILDKDSKNKNEINLFFKDIEFFVDCNNKAKMKMLVNSLFKNPNELSTFFNSLSQERKNSALQASDGDKELAAKYAFLEIVHHIPQLRHCYSAIVNLVSIDDFVESINLATFLEKIIEHKNITPENLHESYSLLKLIGLISELNKKSNEYKNKMHPGVSSLFEEKQNAAFSKALPVLEKINKAWNQILQNEEPSFPTLRMLITEKDITSLISSPEIRPILSEEAGRQIDTLCKEYGQLASLRMDK
jgi:hypothetical protein